MTPHFLFARTNIPGGCPRQKWDNAFPHFLTRHVRKIALLPGNYRKRPANTGVNTDGGTELTGANFVAHGHEIPATKI